MRRAVLERAVAAARSWRCARPEAVMRAAEALGDVRLSLGELERARDRRSRSPAGASAAMPVERARLLRKEGDRRLPARRVRARRSEA